MAQDRRLNAVSNKFMKVAFLQKDSFVKIAIEQLSAVIKHNGHECELFIESGERNFLRSALQSKADIFAFSCTTGGEYWVTSTAEQLKQFSSRPVIVGGPHPTFFPEIIENRNIDFICRGEGEYALLELLDALRSNPGNIPKIDNIWSKNPSGEVCKTDVRPFIEDLDSIPPPDFDLYSKYKYLIPYNRDMYSVITGRGCPYNCDYCFNKTYKELYSGKGRYLRRRSPGHVIAELLHARQAYGIRKVNFIDDSFFTFPAWLNEFAGLYEREINLPFIINVEATQVRNDLVKTVKDMGCICIRMGVETGNEHLRQTVLNKKITNRQIHEAAGHIKQHGISLTTYNILGLPGETVDNAIETYLFNKEIGSDFIWCSLLQPYPGTSIYQYISENGLLDDANDSVLDESFFVSTKIRIESKKEITNLQKLMQFFLQVGMPVFMIRRIIKLPANPVFDMIFKLYFIFNKLRLQKIRLMPAVFMGLHSLSYMRCRAKA
jgi:radical SAM superfamily enzyme YgiQ (UPF0313 family)